MSTRRFLVAIVVLVAVAASACGNDTTDPPAVAAGPTPTATAAPDDGADDVPDDPPPTAAAPEATAPPTATPTEPPPARPNIVVFLTDDQTVEQMRVLDRVNALIGDRGMTFTNSVVNYPTCCPSRATLLTGQHARNHGVLWNAEPTGGFSAFTNQETTLPVALLEAGYSTIFLGKYLNGYGFRGRERYVPPGWTDFRGLIAPTEVLYYDSSIWDNGVLRDLGPDAYITDVLTEQATEAVRRETAAGNPFFMLVAHVAPHATAGLPLREYQGGTPLNIDETSGDIPVAIPAERHVGLMADEQLPDVPSFNEDDIRDKPRPLTRQPLDEETRRQILVSYRTELESLLSVDESVEAVIDELDAQGVLDNTYLVFTSDNGYFHGEHRFGAAKYFAYEPSVRVPLLIAGPGIEPGTTDAVVSNVDLAPTFYEIAGAEALRPPDGRSLLSLLHGDQAPWTDRAVFIEGHAPNTLGLRPPYNAVHTGDAVYILHDEGQEEFYDLVADPHQLTNLIYTGEQADRVQQYRALLDELRSCAGQACNQVRVDRFTDDD